MMFQRQHTDARRQAWAEFAARLELEDAAASAERMRRWLDLEGVSLDPVYALRRPDQPTLYIFEYVRTLTGPTGSIAQTVWSCLLRSDEIFAPLALRAHPKRNKVLESLEASRTGSVIVRDPGGCGEDITVFARDAERAARVVTAAACRILSRALLDRGAASVVVGERHVLATVEPAASEDAADGQLAVLEPLATDVYALYALLGGSRGVRRG